MYPYDIDPRSYINSALALQTPTGAGMPQMTPASRGYYGPTHQALSNTLAAALAKQASNAGIFVPPPADNTGGLLSPATPAASFFRMPSDFSNSTYVPPTSSTTLAPSINVSNTAQTSSGGGHNAPEQPTYSPDFTRSNGPVGTANGFTGPYSNGGGPGDSFVDGSLLGGIGNFFYALTHPASTPTSIDATVADTKTAGVAPTFTPASTPTYRLSTNDMMPGIGVQPSIMGTPLAPPSNDMMPGIGAQPSITGTDIGTPMQEPSQTLNGLLMGNYEPVTGYSNNFSRLTSADLSTPPADSKIQDRIISAEDVQNNSEATRQQAEQAAAQEAANLANLRATDAAQAAAQDAQAQAQANNGGGGGASSGGGGYSSSAGSSESRSNYTGGYGPPGGGGGDGGDSRGGPITKKKLFGNKPNNGDDGWGTLKQGEYVIRPESVKVLPPGLLSALNDIYKSPNPKKTLRGLLG